jgi:Na+/melibiose symporter-like transporter
MKTLLLALVVVVGTAAPLLLMWALYQGFIGEWERYGTEERRRGLVAGAITVVLVVAATLTVILIDPAGK